LKKSAHNLGGFQISIGHWQALTKAGDQKLFIGVIDEIVRALAIRVDALAAQLKRIQISE
jgi:hypothetical protein